MKLVLLCCVHKNLEFKQTVKRNKFHVYIIMLILKKFVLYLHIYIYIYYIKLRIIIFIFPFSFGRNFWKKCYFCFNTNDQRIFKVTVSVISRDLILPYKDGNLQFPTIPLNALSGQNEWDINNLEIWLCLVVISHKTNLRISTSENI